MGQVIAWLMIGSGISVVFGMQIPSLVSGSGLVGLLRRRDVVKWLQMPGEQLGG